MSQLNVQPSIFDSIFSASILPRRTSNLSKSTIGEFGGLYQLERRNGLALGFWMFNTQELKIRVRKVGSDFKINDPRRMYMATPPPPLYRSRLTSRDNHQLTLQSQRRYYQGEISLKASMSNVCDCILKRSSSRYLAQTERMFDIMRF